MGKRRKLPLTETDYIILKALKDGKEHSIRQLARETGLTTTGVEYAVVRLKEKGLVEERREEEFPFRRLIRITEKGLEQLKVLEMLEQFFDIKELLQKRRGPKKRK